MALSNSQYNAVMRDYQQQQLKNRHEKERRIEQLYEQNPQILVLDQEITSCAAACARKALEGDLKGRKQLEEKLKDLREQKNGFLLAGGYGVDYLQETYRCGLCRDTGYADGKKCRCFEDTRRNLLYAQSNIREVLERENFKSFSYSYFDDSQIVPALGITEREYMKHIVKRCKAFAKEFPIRRGNLLLTGNTGVGKTFLANCIAKDLIDQYVSVIYLSSHDLFEIFSKHRFSYDPEESLDEIYHSILECEMLMIDDLGTEVNNTFVSSQLFYCINERINRKLGTVISTNLSTDQLRDAYSDRVTSRIVSHYTTIPLYGGDIRMKKRQFARD